MKSKIPLRENFAQDMQKFLGTVTDIRPNRTWLYYTEAQIYVRAMRLNGVPWYCLASIEVYKKYLQQGHFNFVLDHLESLATAGRGRVSVESIQNEIVEEAVKRRGYVNKDPMLWTPTYYKDFGMTSL